MQRLLADGLWEALKKCSREAERRKAAIAYVTVDHLCLRSGDQLVVDASTAAITSGETKAKVLAALDKKGVEVYSLPGLHAKVALLDDVAFRDARNARAGKSAR